MPRQSTSELVAPPRNSEKNLGPFEVIGTPRTHSFTICLPQQFWAVYLVFYISQLELAKPDPFPLHWQPPPPQMTINGNLEYKVSEILNPKIDCHFCSED